MYSGRFPNLPKVNLIALKKINDKAFISTLYSTIAFKAVLGNIRNFPNPSHPNSSNCPVEMDWHGVGVWRIEKVSQGFSHFSVIFRHSVLAIQAQINPSWLTVNFFPG